MPTTIIRVQGETHRTLKELARLTGRTMQEVLALAVESERRKVYLEGLNADYLALQRDPKAAVELRKEHALWDATNKDGLEDA